MKYIVAPIAKASGNVICNLDARRRSGGKVLLNETDLKRMECTLEERAAHIDGIILDESAAFELINSEEWRNEQ